MLDLEVKRSALGHNVHEILFKALLGGRDEDTGGSIVFF